MQQGEYFVIGGGTSGATIRSVDWSLTPLGQQHTWSRGLQTGLNLMLSCGSPMLLFWGDDLICFYNDAFDRIAQQSKQPLTMGANAAGIWPELWQIIRHSVHKVMQADSTDGLHDQLLKLYRNNQLLPTYWNIEFGCLYDENKSNKGVIVVCHETTGHVIGRQQIAAQCDELLLLKHEFGFAMDVIPQMLWSTLPNGEVDYFNRHWFDYTGLPFDQIKGNQWIALLHPADVERTVDVWQTAILQSSSYEVEYRIRRHDGVYRWFLARGMPMKNTGGTIVKWYGSTTDIDDHKIATSLLEHKVEERTKELREANEQLHKINTDLEQFAYIASHDLQEPLRKVRTFTDMLQNSLGDVNEKSKLYLAKISSSSNRMLALIKDVLNFSQLSLKGEEYRQVNLSDIINDIKNDYELLIEEKKAIITLENLPIVDGIALQLNQLFSNLISNALKFTMPDKAPEIRLSAAMVLPDDPAINVLDKSLQYYRIKVKDNGIGFEQEYAEQIFTIFQRLNDKHSYIGTGIGLAICRKIVTNHGGIITALSSPGNGAEFNVIIPAKQLKGKP